MLTILLYYNILLNKEKTESTLILFFIISLLFLFVVMVSVFAYFLIPYLIPEKFYINKCVRNIKAIRKAADSFYYDTGTLPCTKSGGWLKDPGFVKQITLSNCWPNEGGCTAGCTDIAGWNGPYLKKWPNDSLWLILVDDAWKYNWNRYYNYGGCVGIAGVITLEVYQAIPTKSLQKIDEILDDGDLTTGNVFLNGGGNYLQFLKCY